MFPTADVCTSNFPPVRVVGLGLHAVRAYQEACLRLRHDLQNTVPVVPIWSFSTDGSFEDFQLTHHLAAVPHILGSERQHVLPRREGAIDLAWVKIAQGGAASISTADLERVIDGINTALNADRFDVLNEVYRHAAIDRMATETIISFLRVPFMGRHRLKDWRAFRERAKAEFGARGLDADRLTRGLA